MAVVDSLSDPYAALGVSSDASPATIRSSYKKLMLQCHPDKVRDEAQKAEKAALYEKVQQAYELLSDNRKRRKYDEEVARGGNPAAAAARANGVPPPPKNGAAPGTTPPSDGFGSRDREKEREKRHERRRQRQEEDARRSRDETFGGEDPYQSRRSSGHTRYRDPEPGMPRSQSYHESRHGHTQEIPIPRSTRRESTFPGSSASYRYPEEPSPRSNSYAPNSYEPKSYETKNSYESSHGFSGYQPSPPRQSVSEEPIVGSVREGYVETKMTEKQKLDEVRRKINGGAPPMTGSRTSRSSGSHDDDPERLAQRQRAREAEAMRRQESEMRRKQEAEMQAQAAAQEMFRQQQAAEMLRQQQMQAAAAERERQAALERAERERIAALEREREREREQREKERREKKVAEKNRSAQEKLAERMGRPTNLTTPNRTRKTSSSPSIGRRRGSSTVSRDDNFPHARPNFQATGESFNSIESTLYGTSLPPLQKPSDRVLRRRHSVSSPSLEKQNARQTRDSNPVQTPDSGYSSPSSPPVDTPTSFAKKSSNLNPNTIPPAMVRSTDRSAPPPAPASSNGTAEPPQQQGDHQWKQYTVRVLVRDDGVTQTVPVSEPTDDVPSALSSIPTSAPLGRKLSSSTSSVTTGSPGTVHAEPMLGSPPSAASSVFGDPTAYVASRATALPTTAFYSDSVHNASPLGNAYKTSSYAGSASHISQSHHSSPRHRDRHHSSSHHHASPKLGADGFSPRSSRRTNTAAMDSPYGSFVQPAFVRGQTWNGPS